MTKQELDAKIKAVEIEANRQKHLVYRQYAAENAKYKIGDIISDESDTIRIEDIHFVVYQKDISIFYKGVLLTKNGTPRKDGARRSIFEERIINK